VVLQQLGGILMNTFRSEDIVARWGGEEFLIGMYGMATVDGVQRLTELLESVRSKRFVGTGGDPIQVTFSAGVAQYPEHGKDVQALYRAADQALYRAKQEGRNRVVPVGWRQEFAGEDEALVDVVLVEDDESLGAVAVEALEGQGYRVRWLTNGEEAALMLGGEDPALRAPAIVLDSDLPGLDGLGILRRLARDGVLRRSRVIMLAERGPGSTIGRAYDLGAFDGLAKPIALPVLVRRVRRAVEVL
jgi:PleD family two-component response regulator